MSDNYIYIPETGNWEIVQLNEYGFPEKDEMLEPTAVVAQANQTDNELFDDCSELAKNHPIPEGMIMGTFDCETRTWYVDPSLTTRRYFASTTQEWPSWKQEPDNLWYAPVDPPSDGFVHVWDEVALGWHMIKPRLVPGFQIRPEGSVTYEP